MDIKQLYYFVTVVNEGNISAAAKKLHMSQPPLSTQIHRLEDELGCVLFERGARKIQLTEAGHMLYSRALTLIDMSDIITKELRDYSSGTKGVLRLGIVSSVEEAALELWIEGFHKKYPDIAFEISEANTYEMLDMLRSNLLEIAFIRTPFFSNDMDMLEMRSEHMYAVGSDEFIHGGDSITVGELARLPLIIYKRWESIFKNIFSDEGLRANIVCLNEDARTTAAWAARGMGVGILPESALSMAKGMKSLRIDDARFNTEIYMTAHKNTYRSSIAAGFWKYVAESIE